MSLTLEQFGIDRLDPQQRQQLMELIWDSIPDQVSFTPPEWHRRELEQRLKTAQADPNATEPWVDVLARLLSSS